MEIKPCPFCGSDRTYLTRSEVSQYRYWCECDNCKAQGPHQHEFQDAVGAWDDIARRGNYLNALYLIAHGYHETLEGGVYIDRDEMQEIAKEAFRHEEYPSRPPD